MSNTYTQLYIQAVFAVKHRQSLINFSWQDRLYSYMGGILKELKHKPLAINGMPDYIHLFFGLNPSLSISDTMREVKRSSTSFIREQIKLTDFQWQEGYGAFSYCKSQISSVCTYIENQKDHHRVKTFKEEYIGFLKEYDINYEERYLFEFFDLSPTPTGS